MEQEQVAAALAAMQVEGVVEAATRETWLRRELSKVGQYNDRLRDQLRRLNAAHARAKRKLHEKSEEHKKLHKVARVLVESTSGPVSGQVFVGADLLANLKDALPILKPRKERTK